MKPRRILGVNRNVFFLGLTAFFQDMSGEMIFTILPLFLANVLGVSTSIIGFITGLGDSVASLLKLAGGWLSDRIGRHKALTGLGYVLSTAAKPFLYVATAWGAVAAIRFADRMGKGIRTSPRDALLAESAEHSERGKAFGFHSALDTLGAVVGLAGAAVIVYLLQRGSLELGRPTFQVLVLVGLVPGVLGVLVLLLFVKDIHRRRHAAKENPGVSRPVGTAGAGLDGRFKVFLGIMVIFSLGNSSEAFLILRAQHLGISVFGILLVLILFNMVYTLLAVPAGSLSDRLGRRKLILAGWAFYALVYLLIGLATEAWQLIPLFALYGVYHGLTEGVARAYVADLAPPARRGTAYGWYHGLVGISLLPAGIIAGVLWEAVSPAAPFLFASGLAMVALVGFGLLLGEVKDGAPAPR